MSEFTNIPLLTIFTYLCKKRKYSMGNWDCLDLSINGQPYTEIERRNMIKHYLLKALVTKITSINENNNELTQTKEKRNNYNE